MRPGLLVALLFAALAGAAILLAGAAGWIAVSSGAFADIKPVLLVGGGVLLAFLFALTIAWAVMHLRLIRPLEAITREVETLSHAKKVRPIEVSDGHTTGGLVDALDELVARFIAARQETDKAVETATERSETLLRRLEAILLDLSEGVIVCNPDYRILLYNQAAARLLKRPEALGLGRSLFRIIRKEPILNALEGTFGAAAQQSGPACPLPVQIVCTPVDGDTVLNGRLAAVMAAEGVTEGYILTLVGPEEAEEEAQTLPPRPEFYDFDLFTQKLDREVTETPLRELRCVVFDTETTGLQPSKGDEMISIGAVRVINGRAVTGETFERLINPGRKIPKASIRFHGITDADVQDQPSAAEILPLFRAFTGRAVLVAHNAAFDMKFLQMKEKATGVAFTNPVLDILLLSAFLHDHATDQSLNATAERLGVDISGRHTALGDAMTTARILLALLDPLHARGVTTLGDALDVSAKMVKIRKQQAKF